MINGIKYIIWGMLIFSFYFQIPIKPLASLIIPLLFIYVCLNIKCIEKLKVPKILLAFYFGFMIYMTIYFAYSLFIGISIGRVVRFYLILSMIPLCFLMVKENFRVEYEIFEWFSILKSILLISIALILFSVRNDFMPFRIWAGNNNLGDIYVVYGFIPRVQQYGNALLVMGFIISYIKNNGWNLKSVTIFLGVLVAGNFSFILSLALFFLYRYLIGFNLRRIKKKKVIFLFFLIMIGSVFLCYAGSEMNRKKDTGNKLKIIQAKILMDTNLLIGNGLGQIVPENEQLNREPDAIYYELQTMYIFYQIGFIGLGMFMILTLMLAYKHGKTVFVLYLIYLVYSFFNPYCFDTTQMIAILLLVNLNNRNKIAIHYLERLKYE